MNGERPDQRPAHLGTRLPLKVNMLLSGVKSLMSVLFPLITFPYISRILGVERVGRYDFAHSIISYFLLIAGLGISKYAIREGAGIRDREDFPHFVSEMFSINVVTTAAAYILLTVTMAAIPRLRGYRDILLVLSIQIAFTTLGVEWIYSIFEDYVYITVRSILFQLLSLVLMFACVRTKDDLLVYAVIVTVSSTGANIMNFLHARRYCRVRLTRDIAWGQHLKPILILFGMSLTVTIYVVSDTTILGALCGEYEVGIYSASVKVYTAVKTVLSAMLVVSVPRLSALLGKNDSEGFEREANDIYATLLTFVLPAILGIILLRRQIILLLAGPAFAPAQSSLALLAVAMFFCMGAWFWGQCILIPVKMDWENFRITVVSAILNIVLNFVLIPRWKENAAAFTTILAEGVSFLGCRYYGKKYVALDGIGKILAKIMAGCAAIVIVWWVVQRFISGLLLSTVCTFVASVLVYFAVEMLLGNTVVVNALQGIKKLVKVK